ncbi:hypothetical protein LLG95_02455 [bacterium]|nr:hypothetical protein [bacterium]
MMKFHGFSSGLEAVVRTGRAWFALALVLIAPAARADVSVISQTPAGDKIAWSMQNVGSVILTGTNFYQDSWSFPGHTVPSYFFSYLGTCSDRHSRWCLAARPQPATGSAGSGWYGANQMSVYAYRSDDFQDVSVSQATRWYPDIGGLGLTVAAAGYYTRAFTPFKLRYVGYTAMGVPQIQIYVDFEFWTRPYSESPSEQAGSPDDHKDTSYDDGEGRDEEPEDAPEDGDNDEPGDDGGGPGRCSVNGLPIYNVNLDTLNLFVRDTDFSYEGLGPKVSITRSYNSQVGGQDRPVGMFGVLWRFEHEWRYTSTAVLTGAPTIADAIPNAVAFYTGTGEKLAYNGYDDVAGTGFVFRPVNPANRDKLVLSSAKDYWLLTRDRDHMTYRFAVKSADYAPKLGRLDRITDRFGKSIAFTYMNDTATTAPAFWAIKDLTDAAGRKTSFTYDGNWLCTKIALPGGRQATFEYDPNSNLTASVDPLGTRIEYTYGTGGGLISRIKVNSKITQFEYRSANGRSEIASITNAAGHTTRYTKPTTTCTLVTDPLDRLTTHTFNAAGQTVRIQNHLGHVTAREYTNGRLTKSIGPRGGITTSQYDAAGNLISRTDPTGARTAWTYDAKGNKTSMRDALGQTTSYTHDAAGNVLTITSPGGGKTRMAYNALGQLTSTQTAMGNTTRFEYDAFGNLKKTIDPLGNADVMEYDAQGIRCIAVTDRRGNKTRMEYDANGRITKLTHPDHSFLGHIYIPCTRIATIDENDHMTSVTRNMVMDVIAFRNGANERHKIAYDANDNLTTRTDPLGRVTRFEYDAINRQVRAVDRLGNSISRVFDNSWNLLTLTDERGNRHRFGYDAANRLIAMQDELGNRMTITRDTLGRVASFKNSRGQTVSYQYTADGRIARKLHDGTLVAQFEHDADGRLTSATGRSPEESMWFLYDSCQRIVREGYGTGLAVNYTRDAQGNPTRIVYPGGLLVVDYGYDSRNRLTKIAINGSTSTITLDPAGNVTAVARPNAVASASTFDAANRVTAFSARKGAAAPFIESAYAYNANGNITQENSTLPLSPIIATQARTATYNKLNQIVQCGGAAYQYDLDGNLASVTGARSWSGQYDPENRLTRVTRNGVETAFTYDALGRRVRSATGNHVRNYYHDSEGRLLFETDKKNNVTVMYIYAGWRLFAMRTAAGQTYYYHCSPKGDVLALTDGAGNVAAAYAYNPEGLVCNQTGTIYNPFTFCGAVGVVDDGDGLYLMRRRHYDARTGRFIQRDPAGISGGTNLYRYARNNPVNEIDPFGLDIMSGTADLNSCTMPTNMSDASFGEDTAQFIKDTTIGGVETYSEIPGAPGSGIYKGGKALYNGDLPTAGYEFGKEAIGVVGTVLDILEKILPQPPIDPETGRVIFPDNGFPEYNNTGW